MSTPGAGAHPGAALLPGRREGGAGSGLEVLGRVSSARSCPVLAAPPLTGLSLVPRAVNGFDQGPPGLGGSRPSSAPGMLPLSV